MYLFFDGVSSRWYIALLDKNRDTLASRYFEISWNESTQTIPIIDDFLSKNSISYQEIENIICVVWPGSFTGIRTISLVVNTLSYIYPHIHLSPINFFDMFQEYPAIKSSSKRDLFVKYEKSTTIEVCTNSDFEAKVWSKTLYGDINLDRFTTDYTLISDINYESFCKNISLQQEDRVAPMYIKKPNIS